MTKMGYLYDLMKYIYILCLDHDVAAMEFWNDGILMGVTIPNFRAFQVGEISQFICPDGLYLDFGMWWILIVQTDLKLKC